MRNAFILASTKARYMANIHAESFPMPTETKKAFEGLKKARVTSKTILLHCRDFRCQLSTQQLYNYEVT